VVCAFTPGSEPSLTVTVTLTVRLEPRATPPGCMNDQEATPELSAVSWWRAFFPLGYTTTIETLAPGSVWTVIVCVLPDLTLLWRTAT
jgi:hypothetical protein